MTPRSTQFSKGNEKKNISRIQIQVFGERSNKTQTQRPIDRHKKMTRQRGLFEAPVSKPGDVVWVPQVVPASSVSHIFPLKKGLAANLTAGADRGAVHDLAGLERGPLVALDPDGDGEKTGQEGNGLDTHLLALVHLGLGGPVQELDDILGHLGGGGGGTVLVLDNTVEQDTGHSNTYHRVRNAKKK